LPADVTVASMNGIANVTLADGRRIHIPMLNGYEPNDTCDRNADQALAEELLLNKTARISRPVDKDTPTAVPAGYLEADVAISNGDYATQFGDARFTNREERCPDPVPEPVTTTSPTPSSGSGSGSSGSYSYDHDDHNMPDGALTGGYCGHKWWC
ncbi:MAG: hypothetical protein L0I76_36910, partial [Pseudonocardia sp.]|nr:hypothetical protein [Pseudonocardia sp.]